MIRLYDGSKVVDIEMNEMGIEWFDEVAFFQDGRLAESNDFINSAVPVYVVPDVEYCIDYVRDWENCAGDFSDDFEEYLGNRYALFTRMSFVRIAGGENDGMVARVFAKTADAKQFAAAAEAALPENEQGVVFYCVFDEDGSED